MSYKYLLLLCAASSLLSANVSLSGKRSELSGKTIVSAVNKHIGLKYVWGGNSLKRGVDCSALVKEVYKKYSYHLPRKAEWQALNTEGCPAYTDLNSVKVGEALYFRKGGMGAIHHVAFVTGFDKVSGLPIITHAKGRNYGVVREVISSKYIQEFYVGKRFWECTSPLKGKFSNVEIAKAIEFNAEKYNLEGYRIFKLLAQEKVEPLRIIVYVDRAEYKKTLFSIGSKDIAVRELSPYSMELLPSSLSVGKNLAIALKAAHFPFRAGLLLASDSYFSEKSIVDIFYPSKNIEVALGEIETKCPTLSSKGLGSCFRKNISLVENIK